jgi:antirestriction protein ArdC
LQDRCLRRPRDYPREIRDDHAADLGHWHDALQEDKRSIFSTADHAQSTADFLQALQELKPNIASRLTPGPFNPNRRRTTP